MKGKSIATQIITTVILLIAAFGGSFSPAISAWLGVASMALVLVLSTFAPSGTWVKGWNVIMWATNIGGILVQILNATSEVGLVAVNITNAAIIVINIILQIYFTDKVLPAKAA